MDIELAEKTSASEVTPETVGTKEKDIEAGTQKPTPRPTKVLAAIYIGMAVALSTCTLPSLPSAIAISFLFAVPLSIIPLTINFFLTLTFFGGVFFFVYSLRWFWCQGPHRTMGV